MGNHGHPFPHWTRSSGTHLAFMPDATHSCYPAEGVYVRYLFGSADRHHILNSKVSMAKHFVDPYYANAKLVLWFDGTRFHAIGAHAALEIAQQYQRRIEAAWQKPARFLPRETMACFGTQIARSVAGLTGLWNTSACGPCAP